MLRTRSWVCAAEPTSPPAEDTSQRLETLIRVCLFGCAETNRSSDFVRSAMKDVDYNLAHLWELTATKTKCPKQTLVSARLQEIALELYGVLHSVLVSCQPPWTAHQTLKLCEARSRTRAS